MQTIRRATTLDCTLLYYWANDPEVRNNSNNPEPIHYDYHCKWLRQKLSDPNCYIYIGYSGGVPVGQVRFDKAQTITEIDISIDKTCRGLGLGRRLLQEAMEHYYLETHNTYFLATIKITNAASIELFKRLGFDKIDETNYEVIYRLIYEVEEDDEC